MSNFVPQIFQFNLKENQGFDFYTKYSPDKSQNKLFHKDDIHVYYKSSRKWNSEKGYSGVVFNDYNLPRLNISGRVMVSNNKREVIYYLIHLLFESSPFPGNLEPIYLFAIQKMLNIFLIFKEYEKNNEVEIGYVLSKQIADNLLDSSFYEEIFAMAAFI